MNSLINMNLHYKKNPFIKMNESIHDLYTQYRIYFTFPSPPELIAYLLCIKSSFHVYG